MNADQLGRDLGVTDDDKAAIRSANSPRFLPVVVGGLITVLAFVLGFVLGRQNADPGGYPYSSLAALGMAASGRKGVPRAAVLITAIASIISFGLGTAVAGPPAFGVSTYYGVYGTKI